MIAILRGGGLRRAEVVDLDVDDFAAATGAVRVRRGESGKGWTVYLPDEAVSLVSNWLTIKGIEPGPLLCHINKAQRVVLRRLTPQAVLYLMQKRAESANVTDFSPHDFRRTFISDLLDAGTDIVTVQKLAGHADPATTSRYDRRGEDTLRRAVKALHIPSN